MLNNVRVRTQCCNEKVTETTFTLELPTFKKKRKKEEEKEINYKIFIVRCETKYKTGLNVFKIYLIEFLNFTSIRNDTTAYHTNQHGDPGGIVQRC